ncbi:hypothetical protein C8F04DRAFT_918443, partial [Mycena alexandri]
VPLSHSTPLFMMPNYDPGPVFSAPPVKTSGRSTPQVGSFAYDLQRNYKLRWESLAAMHAWMKQECLNNSIEFVKKISPRPTASITAWKSTDIYVCSRQGSGGKSKYCTKKGWGRKIPSKRTGCLCRLTVKTYPGTSEVLGFYKSEHTHATGDENLKYLRLDKETRLEIETMLRL